MCYYKQLRREYLLSRMKENRKFKNNTLRRKRMENTLTEKTNYKNS